ncbi:hypothetical protein QTO12_04980 [Vibrio owensii]|uniref:hypothetical protein n=1 Tax=Vibrio owensii TaxID=696485 RepID=UPI002F403E9B
MNTYQYPTIDDLTEEQREQLQNNPAKEMEYRLNKYEILLKGCENELEQERRFYKFMPYLDIYEFMAFIHKRNGKYPLLTNQLDQHLAFTNTPKFAALTFIEEVKPELIKLQDLLLSESPDLKSAHKIVSEIRGLIP